MAEKILDQERAEFDLMRDAFESKGSADYKAWLIEVRDGDSYEPWGVTNDWQNWQAAWKAARRAVPAGCNGGFAFDVEKIKLLLERIECVTDEGPCDEGWQSEELKEGIAELERMLAAAPDLKEGA